MEWSSQKDEGTTDRRGIFDGANDNGQGRDSQEQEAKPSSRLRDLRPEKDPMGAARKATPPPDGRVNATR